MNIDVRTTAYPKKWQRKLTARPSTSKRWERQNSNASATATAAPQTSAYPKSNSACSLHSTGAAGKRDMRMLCGDRTLAKRKASPRSNTFCRQTSLTDLHSAALRQYLFTANKLILQTRAMRIFCRRNTARIYSAASRQSVCQTQQSAAPLQSSISRRRPYKTKSPTRRTAKGIRLWLAKPRVANTATPSDRVPRFALHRFGTKKKNLQRLQVLFLQKHFSGDI